MQEWKSLSIARFYRGYSCTDPFLKSIRSTHEVFMGVRFGMLGARFVFGDVCFGFGVLWMLIAIDGWARALNPKPRRKGLEFRDAI